MGSACTSDIHVIYPHPEGACRLDQTSDGWDRPRYETPDPYGRVIVSRKRPVDVRPKPVEPPPLIDEVVYTIKHYSRSAPPESSSGMLSSQRLQDVANFAVQHSDQLLPVLRSAASRFDL